MSKTNPITAQELQMLESGAEFKPTTTDRLTLNLQLCYEQSETPPVGASVVTSKIIQPSEEEAYRRKLKIKESSVPLDLGWLLGENITAVFLENYRPPHKLTPSPEEREEAEAAVLRVSLGDEVSNSILVFPGSFLFFKPEDPSKVRLSSPSGASLVVQSLIIPAG